MQKPKNKKGWIHLDQSPPTKMHSCIDLTSTLHGKYPCTVCSSILRTPSEMELSGTLLLMPWTLLVYCTLEVLLLLRDILGVVRAVPATSAHTVPWYWKEYSAQYSVFARFLKKHVPVSPQGLIKIKIGTRKGTGYKGKITPIEDQMDSVQLSSGGDPYGVESRPG